jgi:hypothetical protein
MAAMAFADALIGFPVAVVSSDPGVHIRPNVASSRHIRPSIRTIPPAASCARASARSMVAAASNMSFSVLLRVLSALLLLYVSFSGLKFSLTHTTHTMTKLTKPSSARPPIDFIDFFSGRFWRQGADETAAKTAKTPHKTSANAVHLSPSRFWQH